MTKKLKILLISVLFSVVVVCVCALAGCKIKYTVDELKEKYGLSAQITYFLNSDAGYFNSGSAETGSDEESDEDSDGTGSTTTINPADVGSRYVKNLYYKAGAMPMDISNSAMTSGSTELKVKDGNKFSGWYYVEVDSAGNPLYAEDENGDKKVYSADNGYDVSRGMSMTETAFDFTKPLEENQHIYLCGSFYADVKVELYLLCEGYGDEEFDKIEFENNGETVTVENGGEIEYGSTYIPNDRIGLPNYSAALQNKLVGYTVVDFYEQDEASDTYSPFTGWPIKYPEPDEDGIYHNMRLYLKVLKGEWTVINNYTDLSLMFAYGNLSDKYYIKQDIDCSGQEVRNQSSFSGIIYGGSDGSTISNLVVHTLKNVALGSSATASMFGTVSETAAMENVSFENLTVNFSTNSDPISICFIANKIEEGATFKQVSISGTLNITRGSGMFTAVSEEYWLYGSEENEAALGITVASATCTITASDSTTVYKVTDNKNDTTINDTNQTEDLT